MNNQQLTKEELYAETEEALNLTDKITWYGFIFALFGF